VGKGSEKSVEAEDWDTNRISKLANMVKIDRESVSGVTLENCCRQADKNNVPLYCRLPEHGERSPKHVAEVCIYVTCNVIHVVFIC
jgi:hypothetical protein